MNTIIGVDVEDKSSVLAPEKLLRLESSVSGWFVLWRYFLEFVGLAGGRHIARHKVLSLLALLVPKVQILTPEELKDKVLSLIALLVQKYKY